MFLKYLLFVLINSLISRSYSVSPFDVKLQAPAPAPITPNSEDVGEPLLLTPLIKSKDIERARNLSAVEPLLDGSHIVSNSGYFTVNETYNSNLFFWFFRKNGSDWQNASVLLWLQGGPGASSMFGLFNENGPYMYTEKGLQSRNMSWSNDYNVLYIDQPVGTGFSFTDSPHGYIYSQEEVADHLYEAVTQFFQLYPELSLNAFYITGESYAGKYIPAISYKIHRMKMSNLTNINLKGLFMISALTNGLVNGLANFCFQVGIIDFRFKNKLEKSEKFAELLIRSKSWSSASKWVDKILGIIRNVSNVNLYDYRKHSSSESEGWEYVKFLQFSKIRRKIHVGNTTFDNISEKVFGHFEEDMAKSVESWIEELVEHYSIAFVGGQYDVRVAHPLVVNVLTRLEWNEALNFTRGQIPNRFIVDGQEVGYYTSYQTLIDILIRDAGHMVPKDQPRATLVALDRFINNRFPDNLAP